MEKEENKSFNFLGVEKRINNWYSKISFTEVY